MHTACERAITRDDYIAVPVSVLVPSTLTGVALYTCDQAGDPMRLFRGPEFPITAGDLRRLAAAGRNLLYVLATEHRRFQEFLREHLTEALQDESRGVVQRFATLNEVARDVLGEVLSRGDAEEAIPQVERLGRQTVELICRDGVVASELFHVLYHDYHTFTHLTNVAYYTVLLAKELGVTQENELCQIATGAMFHDLGKVEIADSLLTKPGKLDDREFAIIRDHPTFGFRRICQRQDVSYGQLMMVYQHHERMDGRGYPVRVSGSEIHDWARMCAVADVFEALTSNRPYRAKLGFEDAFTIMDRSSGTAFDTEVYKCWKTTMRKR